MLQFTNNDQADNTGYPTEGVRIAINLHKETLGGHRVRLSFDPDVSGILRRGLSVPRLHIDGTMANGLRIWCEEQGGMAPTISEKGTWAVTVPVRRLRGREDMVYGRPVAIQWERDETGPVLLIPRVPDELLPAPVLDKLPNSQVDASTIMARAEKRLQREMARAEKRLQREMASLKDEAVIAPEPAEVVPQPPEPETTPGEALQATQPASSHALDLKEALAMVNELIDQLGDEVVLSIDANGHVQAKRRIVQYIDL